MSASYLTRHCPNCKKETRQLDNTTFFRCTECNSGLSLGLDTQILPEENFSYPVVDKTEETELTGYISDLNGFGYTVQLEITVNDITIAVLRHPVKAGRCAIYNRTTKELEVFEEL